MGGRINTIMQTCFFAISGVLPREEAIAQIKHAIEKTYSKRGAEVVKRNFEAVDATLAHLHEVPVPSAVTATPRTPAARVRAGARLRPADDGGAAGRARAICCRSARFPVDGTWPVGTAKWEKRNLALEIPVWDQQDLHPVQPVRAGVSACGHPGQGVRRRPARRAPPTFKSVRLQRARVQGAGVHDPGGARGLHRLQPVRERLPGQGSDQPASTKRSTCTRRRRSATPSGTTTRSFSTCPTTARGRSAEGRPQGRRSSSSRCSSTRGRAPGAARRRTSSC